MRYNTIIYLYAQLFIHLAIAREN